MKTKKLRKSLVSMLLALVMVVGMFPSMALAAEDTPADQTGTVHVTMLHEKQDKPSMCDVMFAQKADVEVRGEDAILKMYVAYPVPAFPEMGKDGTVKNFTVTYNGKTYTAESDLTSQPLMTVKASNPGFGLVAGEEIPAQVLTLTLPKEALNETQLPATTLVNVIMGMNVNFRLAFSDLSLEDTVKPDPEPEPQPEPETPADQLGTAHVTMLHEKQDKPSMCDVMFAQKADVEVRGEDAVLKIYVAYPVPAFPEMGKDGTVKDFTVTYNGKTYIAESDLTSQPLMTVKASNPGFGLVAGEEIPAQVLTLTLPKEALNESRLPATTLVNVIMGMNVNFRLALSELTLEDTVKPEPEPEPEPEPQPDPDPEKPDVPTYPAVDVVDKATGIKVHADKNVFTENVTLVVKPIAKGEQKYDAAAKVLESVGQKFALYDVYFINQNGEEVQPNGKVTVSYPIPEDYDAAKLAVYRINDDSTKTKINGTVEDGYYTVIQKSFSTYALVEEGSTVPETDPTVPDSKPSVPETNPDTPNTGATTPTAPQTGDNTPVAALAALLLVSCAAIAVMVLGKKRRA